MPQKENPLQDRRRYIRLDSVFPVEFRLAAASGEGFISGRLQGFTRNIGEGGICLEANRLEPELSRMLFQQQAKIYLEIEIPFGAGNVISQARVIWIREKSPGSGRYLLGLHYENIDPAQNRRLLRYARLKKSFLPFVLSLIFILGLSVASGAYLSIKLFRVNKALIEQLVNIVQESSIAKQQVKQINREKEELRLKIQALQLSIETILEERQRIKAGSPKIDKLNTEISRLTREENSLQEQLNGLQQRESRITQELLKLDERKTSLEKANADKMYQWLKFNQDSRTGLLPGFAQESNAGALAFTYDQAAAAQVFTNFYDFARAREILDTFAASKPHPLGCGKDKPLSINPERMRNTGQAPAFRPESRRIDFFAKKAQRRAEVYRARDGSPAEHVVYSGANIWLGMAILQYAQKSRDTQYLGLAGLIAQEIINPQSQDASGGVRSLFSAGGLRAEDSLDTFAFFRALHKLTGKEQYLKVADEMLDWFLKQVYHTPGVWATDQTYERIAAATSAWPIIALGPEKLIELGLNPDRILENAEKKCAAEASFVRPEGKCVKIKGFAFPADDSRSAGGVVYAERTARMILAFQAMADFYDKKQMIAKSRAYNLKGNEYLAELDNMIIPSPSPFGRGGSYLVYATQGNASASVAATSYLLFAYYRYNPLQLQE